MFKDSDMLLVPRTAAVTVSGRCFLFLFLLCFGLPVISVDYFMSCDVVLFLWPVPHCLFFVYLPYNVYVALVVSSTMT